MEDRFSPEEISQIVRAARVWAPGFTQEQLQELINSQCHLAHSGFCEAAWGVVRLEKERGVPIGKALDAHEQLLQDNAELEQKVTDFRATLETVEGDIRQAQDKLRQLEEATKRAKAEREREERELAAFKGKATKEKRAIEKELEKCREEADVTKEETATAGQLKAEVAKHGFDLDLALGLAREFAGYEDIRDKLAEGLKRGLTLTKWNEEAAKQNATLQSDKERLAAECQQLGSSLSQLRADEAFEKKLRRFYHRYQGASSLMEYLATWRSIFFARCGNPTYAATSLLNRATRGARFLTEKPPIRRCPCCDYPLTFYDEEPYQALNLPIGESYKLQLGE